MLELLPLDFLELFARKLLDVLFKFFYALILYFRFKLRTSP